MNWKNRLHRVEKDDDEDDDEDDDYSDYEKILNSKLSNWLFLVGKNAIVLLNQMTLAIIHDASSNPLY